MDVICLVKVRLSRVVVQKRHIYFLKAWMRQTSLAFAFCGGELSQMAKPTAQRTVEGVAMNHVPRKN